MSIQSVQLELIAGFCGIHTSFAIRDSSIGPSALHCTAVKLAHCALQVGEACAREKLKRESTEVALGDRF